MTRILYWNIEKFSVNTIYENIQHIGEVIAPPPRPGIAQHRPDMIIIVEAQGIREGVDVQGGLIMGNAAAAALLLLQEIRLSLGHRWCLVPPLRSGLGGKSEGVAVYYDAMSLTFRGPYVWTWTTVPTGPGRPGAQLALPARLGNVARIRNYPPTPLPDPLTYPPDPWRDALPSRHNSSPALQLTRTWNAPDGTLVNEWEGAGQWEYTLAGLRFNNPDATRMGFPDEPGGANRSPFFTEMLESPAHGGRTIKVFAVHTSPPSAGPATQAIAAIPEVRAPFAAREVRVVVGDFNVDSFDDMAAAHPAYMGLINLGYTMLLDPRDPGSGNVDPARRPYCLTHLLPKTTPGFPWAAATPWNDMGGVRDPRHNVYPRFGYMGSTARLYYPNGPFEPVEGGAIDNVFVRYGPGAAAPLHMTTIVNTVVGKPYLPPAGAPGVWPDLTGGYPYDSSLPVGLRIPPDGINPPHPVNPAADGPTWFTMRQNFGRIHDASDHLAILFDV
jgi:hypothetical protein